MYVSMQADFETLALGGSPATPKIEEFFCWTKRDFIIRN